MEITQTPEQIISGYASRLQHHDLSAGITTHVLRTKFINGNQPIGEAFPLDAVLLEPFDCDAHFTQYTCKQGVRCVKADAGQYDLVFHFCAIDVDYDHHGERPTRQSFVSLLTMLFVIDRMPNIMYETRGGCRLIYLIQPLKNVDVFEMHYGALLTRLAKATTKSNEAGSHRYQIDTNVRDWPRLFRCPLVRRDDKPEYDRLVVKLHDGIMDLTSFRARQRKPRVARPIQGDQPYNAGDLYLLRLLYQEMTEGNRNNSTFKALCHTHRTYSGEALDRWVERIRDAALGAGLDEREFESANRSAQQNNEKGSK